MWAFDPCVHNLPRGRIIMQMVSKGLCPRVPRRSPKGHCTELSYSLLALTILTFSAPPCWLMGEPCPVTLRCHAVTPR